MTNKKIIVLILAFAVVAAVLTFYRNPNLMMGRQGGDAVSFSRVAPGSKQMKGKMEVGEGSIGMTEPAMGMRGTQVNPMYRTPSDYTKSTSDIFMPPPYYDDEALSVEPRLYDHSAYQAVVVSNVSEYMRQVKEYLQSNGGKIMHVSQYTSDDIQYAYLDARIPTEKFDEATGLFASRAKKMITESLNTQDVTGQQKSMVDQLVKLEERKAAKATELSNATTVADRQRIQTEIDQINSMIESLKDYQTKFTEDIKYATINLTVADSERYFNPEMGGSTSDELRSALRSLKSTAKVLGVFAIWVAVYAVLWLPIVLGLRWMWSKINPPSTKK